MAPNLEQFRETFYSEAVEHLEATEQALLALETAPTDRELLDTVFRAAHSIKGGAGTFGLEAIAAFTHDLENLLDRARDGRILLNPLRIDLLLRCADAVRSLVASSRDGTPPPPQLADLREQLQRELGVPSPAAPGVAPSNVAAAAGPVVYRLVFQPAVDLFRSGMDPLLLLRDLSNLGELQRVSVDVSGLPPLEELDPESCYLRWEIELSTDVGPDDLRAVFLFVEDESVLEIEPLSRPPTAAALVDSWAALTAPERWRRGAEVVTALSQLLQLYTSATEAAATAAAG